MTNIIYSEFIKLKKSFIIPLVLLGGLAIPSMYFFSYFSVDYVTLRQSTSAKDILSNINLMQIQILDTILFSLIAGYIFSREYTNKTVSTLYSYPISRFKIVICKAIVVFVLVAIVYFLNLSASLITILTTLGMEELKNIFYIEFKTCLISAILQIFILPLSMFIGMVSENLIIPIIYGVIGTVSSMFLMVTDVWMQLSPFMFPVMPFYHLFRGDPIDYIAISLSGGIAFLGAITSIIVYFKNCDIN